ncbi:MAG: BrxA family protein [Syntrophobacteraceae bacterium]|jgi:hypothetical protein
MAPRAYTTELAKGQALIPETLTLLEVWQPGMITPELVGKVLAKGVLSKATALRTKDLVNRAFAHRYLVHDDRPAIYLKRLLQHSLTSKQLSQVFLIHTARANAVLHDFIVEVFWPRYAAGVTHLRKQDALEFLESAVNRGCIPQRWSPPLNDRVARYLLKCLEDFRLLGPMHKGQREMLPFGIASLTTLYLAHELHFSDLSDNQILEHVDWQLFGMERQDVVRELKRVSFGGHFIVQYSGEILRIAWKHKNMEECLDAIAAGEL